MFAAHVGGFAWQTQWASVASPEQTQKSLPGYGHWASALGLHEAPGVGFALGQTAPSPKQAHFLGGLMPPELAKQLQAWPA